MVRCVVLVVMVVVTCLTIVTAASVPSVRTSLVGLKYAQEIEAQLQIIEKILSKSSTVRKNCDSLQTKDDNSTESADDKTEQPDPFSGDILEKTTDDLKKGGGIEPEEMEESEEEKGEDDCDYSEIHANHTMLLDPTECNITDTTVTVEEKELILRLHNELRSMVAVGNESAGDPGPQPSAANMHQLVWNDELAKVAQAWASQCPSGHDEEKRRRLCSRKYRTGQNINYYWGVLDKGPLWENAIENWYNEVNDVDAKVASSFAPHPTKKIGHYTQMVWATSKEIGCGIVYYGTERKGIYFNASITHVCNYGPAGNVLNRPLYEIGDAASKCPGGVSSDYPGLCS